MVVVIAVGFDLVVLLLWVGFRYFGLGLILVGLRCAFSFGCALIVVVMFDFWVVYLFVVYSLFNSVVVRRFLCCMV